MKFRADRVDGEGKAEGGYCGYTYNGFAMYCKESAENVDVEGCSGLVEMFVEIKPETLEVFLFGQWRLVSELENNFMLISKDSYKKMVYMIENGLGAEDMIEDTRNDHL